MPHHRVEAEQRLDQIVGEIAAEDVGRRFREEIDDVALILDSQPAHAAAELQQREEFGNAAPGIGRRAQQPLPHARAPPRPAPSA